MSGAGCSAMSSMLTPASPSASASAAIVPGLLATTIRSSRSGPPSSSVSSRRRRSSPAAACQAATASRSPPRISSAASLEPARDRVDRVGDGLAVAGEDVGPDRRVGAGDAGRVAEARPDLGQPLGVAAELGRRLGGERVGDHVRQVADRRHQAVVGGRVDRLRAGAERGDGALQAVVEQAAGALCRGQVPARALEEVGAGVLDAGGLGPGQRVAADEALVVAKRSDQLALGRADVGDDGVGAASRERRPGLLRQRRDRTGAEDDLRPLTGLGERAGAAVERPQLDRAFDRRLAAAVPDHLGAEALPRGEPDRAADQPHPEDGDPARRAVAQLRRASIAEAKRSSTPTVSSQSRQGSVIDCP